MKDFIFILRNGDYIKSEKKKLGCKRMISGFQNDETSSSTGRNSFRELDDEHIDIDVQQEELDANSSLFNDCQCQITHNGTIYSGFLTNG
jgi:hypothetical protein